MFAPNVQLTRLTGWSISRPNAQASQKPGRPGLQDWAKAGTLNAPELWVDKVWNANQTFNHQGEPGQPGKNTSCLIMQEAAGFPQALKGNRSAPGDKRPSTSGRTGVVDDDWDLEAIADFFGSQP